MIRIFLTGDNHFGKKYDNFPQIRNTLIRSRFDSLQRMVRLADAEGCDFFVVTGDLFDNTNRIPKRDVREVVDILSEFGGRVLVLPGNHDFYTGIEPVWLDFQAAMDQASHSITLLTEERVYDFTVGDETVHFYPAPCHSKHSDENNLGWIKSGQFPEDGCCRVGIAHGALEKLTPDMKNQYFLMSEGELNAIPLDLWLIGHTHIPYPALPDDKDVEGYTVFNAGTHEQTDVSNNTQGCCFLLNVHKQGTLATVQARRIPSGQIFYPCITLEIAPETMENTIRQAIADLEQQSVVRLILTGSASAEEYKNRIRLYDDLLSRFLSYEIQDSQLCQELTVAKIRDSFPEVSLAAKLLEALMDDPVEARMAFDLLQSCRSQQEGNS